MNIGTDRKPCWVVEGPKPSRADVEWSARISADGWTPEICRERMATCRRAAVIYRAYPDHSRYSYRWLNAHFYLQHRTRLEALLSARTQNRWNSPVESDDREASGECVRADSLFPPNAADHAQPGGSA